MATYTTEDMLAPPKFEPMSVEPLELDGASGGSGSGRLGRVVVVVRVGQIEDKEIAGPSTIEIHEQVSSKSSAW